MFLDLQFRIYAFVLCNDNIFHNFIIQELEAANRVMQHVVITGKEVLVAVAAVVPQAVRN